jgi:hypothetical protein
MPKTLDPLSPSKTLDVDVVQAVDPSEGDRLVDAWFVETFHGLNLDTQLFNRFNAAKGALKTRLAGFTRKES